MNKITIEIQTGKGPKSIQAYQYNKYFAVHKLNGNAESRDWSITHIPTGMAVALGLRIRRDACRIGDAFATRLTAEIMNTTDLNVFRNAIYRDNPDLIQAIKSIKFGTQVVPEGVMV